MHRLARSTRHTRPLSPRLRGGKPRVLFFAEAVTLAHVARSHVLAQALVDKGYDVLVARDPRFEKLFGDARYAIQEIRSIPSEAFSEALARVRPIYSAQTLRAYVMEDMAVMEEFRPDLVVGDFRLSLSVSAPVFGVPHLAVTNACWSPYAKTHFHVPALPVVRMLGSRAADVVFQAIRPCAFAWHARPLNHIRHEFGLDSLGLDLRRIYTHADHTFYADLPDLVPTAGLPSNHHYLGPISWSPAVTLPPWWNDLPRGVPVVYVNLGTCAPAPLLAMVLESLSALPITVIAATGGKKIPARIPANAFVAEYLPGVKAAAHARVVICNGGSASTQQALSCGVPVLGIACNLDQYANMHHVQVAGAGVLVRSDMTSGTHLQSATEAMLDDWQAAARAAELRQCAQRYDAAARFTDRIGSLLPLPSEP